MLWLRSLAYFVFLFVTVVPWAFVVLSGWLFPVHTRFWLCSRWTAMAIWGARVICGMKYKVEGWHNLPDGPAIVLPKHQSTWETFWLPTAMRLVHGAEIAADSFVYAALLVVLLARPVPGGDPGPVAAALRTSA